VCVPWEELSDQNLLDYQGILFDCSQGWQIAEQLGLARQLYTFMSSGHTVFVILPRPSEISQSPRLELNFVPYLRLSFDLSKGKTLNLSTPIRIFVQYREALTGHEFVMRPEVQTGSGWVWKAGITDNVSRPVCAVYGNAYLFHPVSRSADSRGLRAILEEFKPDYDEPEPQPSPQWAEGIAVDIPGFIEADREIAESMEQIRAMEHRIGHSRIKKESLTKWVELLWLDGIPLQNRVSDAFKLLGIPNESKDPTGHTQDLQGNCLGLSLLLEVTGSTGSIGVDKGRQLLQWMAECEDPIRTKGVLVGNPFRSEPPNNRPPTTNHKLFAKELEDLAQRFHFALLDVRDLFALIVRKLKGNAVPLEKICQALQKDGVVRFEE